METSQTNERKESSGQDDNESKKNRTWCEVSGAVSLDSNMMFDLVC